MLVSAIFKRSGMRPTIAARAFAAKDTSSAWIHTRTADTGKTAVITGAAKGLGAAFTRRLLDKGSNVALLDMDHAAGIKFTKELAKAYGEKRVMFRQVDVREPLDFQEALNESAHRFGGIDIMINNAGCAAVGFDATDRLVEVDLTSVMNGTRLAGQVMQQRPNPTDGSARGVIINISSIAAFIPVPFFPVYGAAKAGVVHFTRSIAPAFAKPDVNIRVNAMCPAFADTPLVQNALAIPRFKKYVDSLGQLLTAESVAEGMDELIENPKLCGAIKVVTNEGQHIVPPEAFYSPFGPEFNK